MWSSQKGLRKTLCVGDQDKKKKNVYSTSSASPSLAHMFDEARDI